MNVPGDSRHGARPAAGGRAAGTGRDGLCFVPRFAFLDGTSYTVVTGETITAVLARARPERPTVPEVTGIRPTAAEAQVNLLRGSAERHSMS
jgi:hypothetical protein